MASPFPGMDPYLEQFWGDIHHTLITYARDQLNGVLPGGLRARVQERVFVERPPRGEERNMYPDIRVIERGRTTAVRPAGAGGLAVAEPICIRLSAEPVTQGFIEIIGVATGRRVVTVIEVVSPSNKYDGTGRKQYERKQEECQGAGVNLVEIDLLRAGPWVVIVPEYLVPEAKRPPYRACVYRARDGELLGEFYHLPLRKRLPAIAVPLRETDDDVPLDLQALIDQCYRNGSYDEDIDYQVEPVPPLDKGDARWANAHLRTQGRRTGRAAAKRSRKKQ